MHVFCLYGGGDAGGIIPLRLLWLYNYLSLSQPVLSLLTAAPAALWFWSLRSRRLILTFKRNKVRWLIMAQFSTFFYFLSCALWWIFNASLERRHIVFDKALATNLDSEQQRQWTTAEPGRIQLPFRNEFLELIFCLSTERSRKEQKQLIADIWWEGEKKKNSLCRP